MGKSQSFSPTVKGETPVGFWEHRKDETTPKIAKTEKKGSEHNEDLVQRGERGDGGALRELEGKRTIWEKTI